MASTGSFSTVDPFPSFPLAFLFCLLLAVGCLAFATLGGKNSLRLKTTILPSLFHKFGKDGCLFVVVKTAAAFDMYSICVLVALSPLVKYGSRCRGRWQVLVRQDRTRSIMRPGLSSSSWL